MHLFCSNNPLEANHRDLKPAFGEVLLSQRSPPAASPFKLHVARTARKATCSASAKSRLELRLQTASELEPQYKGPHREHILHSPQHVRHSTNRSEIGTRAKFGFVIRLVRARSKSLNASCHFPILQTMMAAAEAGGAFEVRQLVPEPCFVVLPRQRTGCDTSRYDASSQGRLCVHKRRRRPLPHYDDNSLPQHSASGTSSHAAPDTAAASTAPLLRPLLLALLPSPVQVALLLLLP